MQNLNHMFETVNVLIVNGCTWMSYRRSENMSNPNSYDDSLSCGFG